jgi:ribosomal protein L24
MDLDLEKRVYVIDGPHKGKRGSIIEVTGAFFYVLLDDDTTQRIRKNWVVEKERCR